MVERTKIIQSFLQDALRLTAQAMAELHHLEEQATHKRVSPAQVRSFYQALHALKGTAVMVQEAEGIARALHEIEARLACQTVVESARLHDWIPEARHALDSTRAALKELQRKDRLPTKKIEPLVRGLLVRSTLPGSNRLLWFPASCVSRVINPGEMLGQSVLQVDGALVPVIGRLLTEAGREVFGIAVRSQVGRAVIAIEEVAAIIPWSEAQGQGAESGLDLFERGLFANMGRKPEAA
jgi:hypothetical protein